MPWKARLNQLNQVNHSDSQTTLNAHDGPAPLRVVVGIILRDKKILVGKRPEGKTLSGYWEFPGGKIEAKESSLDALRRELQEEIDIEVTNATFWFLHTYAYPDKTVFLDIWIVDGFSGEPKGNEKQKLRWVSKSALKKLQFLEGNALIIEQIIKSLEDRA